MKNGCKIVDNALVFEKERTEIGSHEFFGLEIKKVIIPEGITKIGYWAFGGCKQLEEVVLPSTLVSIDIEAFALCPLKNVVFADNCPQLADVSMSAFRGSPWADAQRNGADCCVVGSVLLSCGVQASSVVVPDGVQVIAASAFSDCKKLTSVTFSDSVDTIADSAFQGCNKLKEIILPKKLKVLGDDVFYKCSGLKRIVFPTTIKTIGENTFKYSRQADTELFGLTPAMLNGCKMRTSTNKWLLDNLWTAETYMKEVAVLYATQSGGKVIEKAEFLLVKCPEKAIAAMQEIKKSNKLKAATQKKLDAFIEKYAGSSSATTDNSAKQQPSNDQGFITQTTAKSFLAYYIVSKEFVALFKRFAGAECMRAFNISIDEPNDRLSIVMPDYEVNSDWYAASYVPECWGSLSRGNAFHCLRAALMCNDDYIAAETDLDILLDSCDIQDSDSVSLLKQLYKISLDGTQEKASFSDSVKLFRVECCFKNSKESAIYEYNTTTGKETLTGKLWDYDYARIKKYSISEDIH